MPAPVKQIVGEPPAEVEDGRSGPGAARRVFCALFAPTWGSAALLAVCFFLPLVRGCANEDIYPYHLYQVDSFANLVWSHWLTGPYLFALIAVTATILAALWPSPASFRRMWWAYALPLFVLITFSWLTLRGQRVNLEEDRVWELVRQYALVSTLTLVFAAALLFTYCNCRTWYSAAIGLQLVVAGSCAAWFTWICMEADSRYGAKIAAAASVLLLLATLWQARQGRKLRDAG